jgi:hypothetical protein
MKTKRQIQKKIYRVETLRDSELKNKEKLLAGYYQGWEFALKWVLEVDKK